MIVEELLCVVFLQKKKQSTKKKNTMTSSLFFSFSFSLLFSETFSSFLSLSRVSFVVFVLFLQLNQNGRRRPFSWKFRHYQFTKSDYFLNHWRIDCCVRSRIDHFASCLWILTKHSLPQHHHDSPSLCFVGARFLAL